MHRVSAAQLTTTDQRSITSPCKHPACAAHSHRRSLCSLKEVSTQISTRRSDYDSERGQRRTAAGKNKRPGERKPSAVRRWLRLSLLRKKKMHRHPKWPGPRRKQRAERRNMKTLGLWKEAVTYYSRSSRRLYLCSIFRLKKEGKHCHWLSLKKKSH